MGDLVWQIPLAVVIVFGGLILPLALGGIAGGMFPR